MRDENQSYYQYNLEIVDRLKKIQSEKSDSSKTEHSIDEAIECYQMIADSMKDNELLVRWFRAIKPTS
ncbi:MAG: hypothetical protein ACE365_02890 [Gammaproteobacteria bacterium]